MSSTTTTQYYGLTQYIGTDKPDWTDNNEAFREVDADLHEAVQAMEDFGTDISALQEAQSALTTEVTGLEADLNTEKAKITALQNKETLQDAEIAGVKADALDMIAAVDEGTAQVATVAVNEGKYFRYNDVLYMATTNIAVGDTIVPNTNCRATNVGTELEAQAEDIAEVKSDLYKEYVIVTGNGVKTTTTLLGELWAQVDTSKLTDTSYIEFNRGLDRLIYEIGYEGATAVRYGHFTVNQLESLNLGIGNSYTRIEFGSDGIVTYFDKSQEVIESGRTFKLYY